MYKTASAKAQGALNARTVGDEMRAGAATPTISAAEQEQNLRRELSRIENELIKLPKTSAMRPPLVKRKTALQTEMTALRIDKKRGKSVDEVAIFARFRLKIEAIMGEDRVKELMLDARIEWATDNGVALEHVLSDWQLKALKEELGVIDGQR